MCKTISSHQTPYFIKLHKYVNQIHLFYKTLTDAILGSNICVTFLSETSKIGYFDIRHYQNRAEHIFIWKSQFTK